MREGAGGREGGQRKKGGGRGGGQEQRLGCDTHVPFVALGRGVGIRLILPEYAGESREDEGEGRQTESEENMAFSLKG